eukprot:TRINITY_DN59_c0_g1_i5.p1 TRINITY_DN59_c0_g1~~TRINITY_DN59_c0_g1_i5.p1  ORF type:complete len:342 (-),score=177.31 TRINITY_DN59_c0_g1_i5:87-1112(-)
MNSKVILIIALFSIICCASAIRSEAEYSGLFRSWVAANHKVYDSVEEAQRRYNIFRTHVDFVDSWDVDARGFSVGLNRYADMSNDEFRATVNGFSNSGRNLSATIHSVSGTTTTALPDTVDWRQKGAVTHVKDQGQCGSCWSFSTTGSIEGQLGVSNPSKMVGLSEQELVDCSRNGNFGCNGGLMDNAFTWIASNKIESESSYPYVSGKTKQAGTCQKGAAGHVTIAGLSGHKDVTSGSESALQDAVANVGPVSVAIDASHTSFQLYTSGVYYEPKCSSTQLDHGVLAVGYGTLSGTPYWLVKNSWGTSWGQQGYIYMSRNKNNNCGIATQASYPTGVFHV